MADTISFASRMSSDASVSDLMREHRNEGIANCGPFWSKAERLKKFAARIQWPEGKNENTDPNRKAARLTIPETSRVLAAFSGRQILERVEREYIPRNQSAARWAETLTKIDKAVCQACDGEQVDSAAFRDGPGIQGISWVRWSVDETGEKPQLKFETVPIWSMMWPATREINLRDRGWHRWGSWWPQATVRDRWADAYEAIKQSIGVKPWSAIEQKHGASSRNPWTGGDGNKPLQGSSVYSPKDRSFWIEYEEWRELVTYFEIARPVDPTMPYTAAIEASDEYAAAVREQGADAAAAAGLTDPMERVELTAADLKAFRKEQLAVHGEDVPESIIARKPRMIYRYAYLCGDTVLEHGDGPVQSFTFQAMAAEVVELPDRTYYIGLLEDLEDAQRMVNYMMSALIRDIQINPKGVLFIEQGLFRDRNDALSAWTTPGGVIEIPRGRMLGAQSNKPYEWVAGGTNAHSSKLESMLAFYREAIPRLAGFNPAALGQLGNDIRRISGEVVRQLTDATMTSNAERVDALRLYRREGGRIFLGFARMLWKPEDLIDFIGEDDAYDDVLDPTTGEPVIDPTTGAPQRRLAIPPKEMWRPDAWKEIAIEEVAPTDNELAALWDSMQTQVQLFLQPMADTGKPLFTAEDFVEILPKLPAARRQKMLLRVRQQAAAMKAQELAARQAQEAQQAQATAQGQGAPGAEEEQVAPPSDQSSPGGEQIV